MDNAERYQRISEKIRKLEAEKGEYLARDEAIPHRISYGLNISAVELEEARMWGHREHVREAQEAQRAAGERSMRDRVEAELERIRNTPTVDAADIRKHRRELGVSQYQLAAASGVDVGTISKIENGFDRYKPETLRIIAAGLEFIRESVEAALKNPAEKKNVNIY